MERCPLEKGNPAWSAKIPETCKQQCGELRENASRDGLPYVDTFTRTCDEESNAHCEHDVAYDDETLENVGHRKRAVTVLNICAQTKVELFSESYEFVCPFADET